MRRPVQDSRHVLVKPIKVGTRPSGPPVAHCALDDAFIPPYTASLMAEDWGGRAENVQ